MSRTLHEHTADRSITVVSLGPGAPGFLTLQTADLLRRSRRLILRTAHHRTAAWLQDEGVSFTALDDLYDVYEDFDELHAAMADKLWHAAAEGPVTFAVIDAATDGAVRMLRSTRPEGGSVTVMPAVSMADACLALLPEDVVHTGSLCQIPAVDLPGVMPDPAVPLMITEIWDRMLASDVKMALSAAYGDEATVIFYPSSAKVSRKPRTIQLMELDRQPAYDHTVCLYIPVCDMHKRTRYAFPDLIRVMKILRERCPWDGEQTHESLCKYLIEEAWEAIGAVNEDDMDHLADELGDVMLQVAFHADIGRSFGEFDITDVTTAIVRKLIYRHAHIFGSVHCDTAEDVSRSWEQLKKAEKGLTTQASVLADVSSGLPALMRAAKVQKKAAQVGFDWDDAISALPKVTEEAQEVLDDMQCGHDCAEELGDLLFSCVNVARLAGHEPELLLHSASEKFIRRFTAMENLIICDGKSLEGLTLAEMDVYWSRVKSAEKGGN